MRPGHRQPRVARERDLTGEALVHQTSERVDVRTAVNRRTFDLLRREVGGCAQRAAIAGRGTLLVESSCQPEVGEIDVLIGIEEDVGGLDVAMHEPLRVARVQRVRDLGGNRQRAPGLERPFRA